MNTVVVSRRLDVSIFRLVNRLTIIVHNPTGLCGKCIPMEKDDLPLRTRAVVKESTRASVMTAGLICSSRVKVRTFSLLARAEIVGMSCFSSILAT